MLKLHHQIRVFLVVFALSGTGQAWANTAVFQKAVKATCWVITPKTETEVFQGTGWVVDKSKHQIVTNYHVVGDTKKVIVYFPMFNRGEVLVQAIHYKRHGIHGEVIHVDHKRDLALVQLPYLPSNIEEMQLAASGPAVGQVIYGIGNSSMSGKPLDQGTLWKFRQGVVSTIGFVPFFQTNTKVSVEARTFRSDCGLASGDSGGPVVNEQGELIGVADAVDNQTKAGISLDVEEVRTFLKLAQRHPRENFVGLEGTWTMKWNAKGQELAIGLIFEPNGTLIFQGKDKNYPGNFTFSKESLTWEVPGLNIRESVTISWNGSESFRFTSQGVPFSVIRR